MDVSEDDGLTFPLVTQRLVLRAMTAEDAPSFHALVTRPDAARMLFIFPTDWPLSEAAPFLGRGAGGGGCCFGWRLR